MAKAIIIGATSGIGLALARVLAREGYALGLAGRRDEVLAELQRTLPGAVVSRAIDISQPEEAARRLELLIGDLGGLDLLIICSGIGEHNQELAWEPERDTIAVNVAGFTAMATAGYRYFRQQGHGHLVGISSVGGLRGSRWALAYAASKAFVINYLEGLRILAHHQQLPRLYITDIRPGFVETPMTAGQQGMFWVAPVDKAAAQIYAAIRNKARSAYITRRWAFMAWVVRHLPARVLERM